MNKAVIKFFYLPFVLSLLFTIHIYGQAIPQGFNYQTSVRDTSGNILPNQTVKILFSFYSNSPSGILQWQETHSTLTDNFGSIKLIIGTGTNTGIGLASSFNQINWASSFYYLNTAIDISGGNTFIDMGASQLFSVPYSFNSLSTNSLNLLDLSQFNDVNLISISSGKLLKWNGIYWIPSIDNDSDTVSFAINSAVSVLSDTTNYIYGILTSDSVLYALYSGSADYSYNSLNTNNSNWANYSDTALYALSINPSAWVMNGNTLFTSSQFLGTRDSFDLALKTNNISKMVIKNNGNINLGNSLNSSSLSILGNNGFIAKGTFGSGSQQPAISGTKLVWYPTKGAIRIGGVTANQWDTANIGNYSMTAGYNTKARSVSFSSGYQCESVDYSVAMGRKSQANAIGAYPNGNSIALGDSCISNKQRCVTIGRNNFADIGAASVVIGSNSKSTSAVVTVLGNHNIASGGFSTLIGNYASSNSKNGCFVYSDASSATLFNSTALHQFSVRASGGVIFYSDSLNTMGVSLPAGGGSWANISDKHKKENFSFINDDDVLLKIERLRIRSWNYKSQSNSIRHIGPMAQDFYSLFKVGNNIKTITVADADGVILSGIKGLSNRINKLQILNEVDDIKSKVVQLDMYPFK